MKQSEIRDAIVRSFAAYHRDQDGTRLAEQVSVVELKSEWESSRIQTTIFLDTAAISEVAYCVRLIGSSYLRALSISEVTSLLRKIVQDNYWRVAGDWARNKIGHVVLGDIDISPICSDFSNTIVSPPAIQFLFPLTALKVDEALDFGGWSLLSPPDLIQILSGWTPVEEINTKQMPLYADETEKARPVNSWLSIISPVKEHAQKLKRIALGAIALCALRRERHIFTLRANSDGYCYLSKGLWTASSTPHMPPITDILLTRRDLPWLGTLSRILASPNKADLRKRNALEYYYNAWFLSQSERCAIFFSSLEAIFGAEDGKAMQGLRDAITEVIPYTIDPERIRMITDLRNSMIHGGAPDAYSSKNYQKYYKKYKYDILDDIEIITETCLRSKIFGENFREQDDPHAELISKYQSLGILPKSMHLNSIMANKSDTH